MSSCPTLEARWRESPLLWEDALEQEESLRAERGVRQVPVSMAGVLPRQHLRPLRGLGLVCLRVRGHLGFYDDVGVEDFWVPGLQPSQAGSRLRRPPLALQLLRRVRLQLARDERRRNQRRSRPAAREPAPALWIPFSQVSCGASSARASISACRACNTQMALRAIGRRIPAARRRPVAEA
jgi:hypothetical protein